MSRKPRSSRGACAPERGPPAQVRGTLASTHVAPSHSATARTAPGPSSAARARRAVSTVRCQPGGTRPDARSLSGASTNRRSAASRCGTTRSRSALPGSSDTPSGGRSMASCARPKIRRSRSSSRGPQRSRFPSSERALDALEGNQQRDRAGCRVRAGRNVEGYDGIQEVRLINNTDGSRRVQPGNAAEADAREGAQGVDSRCERGGRVTQVGPETDIGPDASYGHARLLARLAR